MQRPQQATGWLVAIAIAISGCNGGDESSFPPDAPAPAPTGTSDPYDPVLAAVREILDSTPEAIAKDVNTFSLQTGVTADAVAAAADDLCVTGFDPNTTIAWLQTSTGFQSYLLMGPANRLLTLSGQRCGVQPTPAQLDGYRDEMFRTFSPELAARVDELTPPPGAEEACELLGTRAGGTAVEAALSAALELASRERSDSEVVLPVLAELVTGTCDQWLPDIMAAMNQP